MVGSAISRAGEDSHVAIVAVIIDGGRVLVIQRSSQVPGGGYWSPPAGKVRAGEEQADAVIREVQEEVGLTVRPLRPVWECMADGADYRLYWWLAEPVSGALRLAPEEVADAKWVDPVCFVQLERTFPKGREFFERVLPSLPEYLLRIPSR